MLEVEWYLEEKMEFVLMGLLIAYQFSGIQYLLDRFKNIISDLSLLGADIEERRKEAKTRFAGSIWYYILISIVILPFYLIDWISSDYTIKGNYTLMEQFASNYLYDGNVWSLALDIYQDILGFVALFLLAYILWIIFNIAWTIRNVSLDIQCSSLITNAFSIHMKFKPIRRSILGILFYYSICISLSMLSYGIPGYLFEKITLSTLLLIGLIFFFMGYESLNNIATGQIEFEMDQINKKSREYTQKLVNIDSDGDYGSKIQETNFISNMLDVLQKQREALTKTNTNEYV